MPPKTRSKHRAELLQEREELLASGKANTQGFPALPAELHLQILSYFPNMPVPAQSSKSEEANDIDGPRTRRSTLLALSQSCHALRRIFLGQLWQRIEVFDGITKRRRPEETHWILGEHIKYHARTRKYNISSKLYAKELIRQLEVVTSRHPALAQYVRVVNILITDDFAKQIASKVAKAFSILPHLHTVQIDALILTDDNYRTFSDAIGKYQYPQIRTLSLPCEFYAAEESDSHARLTLNDHHFDGFPGQCQNLEVLGVVHLQFAVEPKAFHLIANLRDISVIQVPWDPLPFSEQVKMLRLLPHLHTIRLRIDIEADSMLCPPTISQREVDKRVQYARGILSEKEGDKSLKRVIVTYADGRIETLGV